MKICADCKLTKSINEFYISKSHNKGVMCYCKSCFNNRCKQRWIDRKLKAINYKGGKCIDCNLQLCNSHYAVFDFHHLDPTIKDYEWVKLRLTSWNKIIQELDKCVLLCSNCHRIRHAS